MEFKVQVKLISPPEFFFLKFGEKELKVQVELVSPDDAKNSSSQLLNLDETISFVWCAATGRDRGITGVLMGE